MKLFSVIIKFLSPGADQGQRDGLGGRGGVLQGQQRHRQRGQRGERPPQHQVNNQSVNITCVLPSENLLSL